MRRVGAATPYTVETRPHDGYDSRTVQCTRCKAEASGTDLWLGGRSDERTHVLALRSVLREQCPNDDCPHPYRMGAKT